MYTYKAYVVSVYDGDTVTLRVDCGFNVSIIEKFRLLRINTPEIRGVERPDGLISRDRLREKILNKEVIIKTEKDRKGKYGRYLCEIFINDENINDWLVTEKLAVYKEY